MSKENLYKLISLYLSGTIDEKYFCDHFYLCYDLELDNLNLTEFEDEIFAKLSEVCGRFSVFEEDLKEYPGTYFSKENLKDEIELADKLLRNNLP